MHGYSQFNMATIHTYLNSSGKSVGYMYNFSPNAGNSGYISYTGGKGITNPYSHLPGVLYNFDKNELPYLYTVTFKGARFSDYKCKVWIPTLYQLGIGDGTDNEIYSFKFDKFKTDSDRIKTIDANWYKTRSYYFIGEGYSKSPGYPYWTSNTDFSYYQKQYGDYYYIRKYIINENGARDINLFDINYTEDNIDRVYKVTSWIYRGGVGIAPCICLPRYWNQKTPVSINMG